MIESCDSPVSRGVLVGSEHLSSVVNGNPLRSFRAAVVERGVHAPIELEAVLYIAAVIPDANDIARVIDPVHVGGDGAQEGNVDLAEMAWSNS